MANFYGTELSAVRGSLPQGMPDNVLVDGKVRRQRATFNLASQAIADTLSVAELPIGAVVTHIRVTASASLGTSTLAFGVAGTPAKYSAAAAYTGVNAEQVAAMTAAQKALAPNTALETVIATIAAAALPASGTLVIEIFYVARG